MAEKLTQTEVLDLMRNGWSCSTSHLGSRSWTLQQGKVGHGGATKRVHGGTMNALIKRRLIVAKPYRPGKFITEYEVSPGDE